MPQYSQYYGTLPKNVVPDENLDDVAVDGPTLVSELQDLGYEVESVGVADDGRQYRAKINSTKRFIDVSLNFSYPPLRLSKLPSNTLVGNRK